MSYYVIDADTLNQNLRTIADIIRQKTLIVGDLEFPNGFIQALGGTVTDFPLEITIQDYTVVEYAVAVGMTWQELINSYRNDGLLFIDSGDIVKYDGDIVYDYTNGNQIAVSPTDKIEETGIYGTINPLQ